MLHHSHGKMACTLAAGVALFANLFAVADPASFPAFDRRARAGDALSVVFFGGSLTYGSNASNPGTTSYRGRMMHYLRETYPQARFVFHDAAIGGTGSDLGLFRLERDVLAHKPDLVFLDFMANDNYRGDDLLTLCFYETLVRTLVERGVVVQQMYFGFKWQFGDGYKPEEYTRRTDYQKLTAAYRLGEGDLFPLMQEAVTSGKASLDTLWPFDAAHPDDPGYDLFFEAARTGFEAAIRDGLVCTAPEKPVFGRVSGVRRIRLADLPLPKGWKPARTYRTSLWYDGLSSRWMDDVVLCEAKDTGAIEPLRLEIEGDFLGFFGEASHEGLDFKVKLNGEPLAYEIRRRGRVESQPHWPFRMSHGQGNLFIWRKSLARLPAGRQVLEIIPIIPEGAAKGQLRIESVCVATYEPADASADFKRDD